MAVRSDRDRAYGAHRCRYLRGKFGDVAVERDAPDGAGSQSGEPHRVIRTRADGDELAVGSGNVEFADDSRRGDPADLVAGILDEPDIAVGPGGNVVRLALGCRDREFGYLPAGGDAPDLVAGNFREPQRAIRAQSHEGGFAFGCGNSVLRESLG